MITRRVNERQFAQWSEEFRRDFRGLALRGVGGNDEAAEDAMQETLLRAWQKLPSFESKFGKPGFFGFLVAILRFVCGEIRRARHHREVSMSGEYDFEQVPQEALPGGDDYAHVLDEIEAGEERQAVNQQIAASEMSNKQWVCVMAQMMGASNEAIAAGLGTQPNVVRAHVSNALVKVRRSGTGGVKRDKAARHGNVNGPLTFPAPAGIGKDHEISDMFGLFEGMY